MKDSKLDSEIKKEADKLVDSELITQSRSESIVEDAQRSDVLDTDVKKADENTQKLVDKADLNTTHKEQVLQALKQHQTRESQDFKLSDEEAKKAINLNTNLKDMEKQLARQFPDYKDGDAHLNTTKASQEAQVEKQTAEETDEPVKSVETVETVEPVNTKTKTTKQPVVAKDKE